MLQARNFNHFIIINKFVHYLTLWRLRARWTLLDVVQSISHTKSGCFSTCSIDSAIFYLFPNFSTFCYFVYLLLLRPGTGRFFRNRRCDFQQSNVAVLEFCFFCIHSNLRACSKYTFALFWLTSLCYL